MKEKFIDKRLGASVLRIIASAEKIVEEFQAQNLTMTLRQLYYQFIAQDLFPPSWIDPIYNAKHELSADTKNTVKNYKRLTGIISDARLCGLIDWRAIEDRDRVPSHPYHHESAEGFLEDIRNYGNGYTIDKWRGQDYYVELWVEKRALAGVLEPMASRHHVSLVVNKGYTSQTAMYDSANRFIEQAAEGRSGVVIYIGDFDPSGEDMVRDIRDRMHMFGADVDTRKIALSWPQIQQYNPPPNPAKLTDPRAEKYIAEHGDDSWEVDALRPDVLQRMVTSAINEFIDRDVLSVVKDEEKVSRAKLTKALAKLKF